MARNWREERQTVSEVDGGADAGDPTVPAIDDIDRIQREGVLWYFRYPTVDTTVDPDISAIVAIVLRTPADPANHCVEECVVEWIQRESGDPIPRIRAVAGSLKMLSLFPTVLQPFQDMSQGCLSPDAYVAGLEQLGIRNIRS